MKTYARIQDGRVVELLNTDADIRAMFHPTLDWVDASSVPGIGEAWTYDGHAFAPPAPAAAAPPGITLAAVQAQVAFLTAQLEALSKSADEDASRR